MTVEAPFDTETMAEIYARQGRADEAIAILRRLAGAAVDPALRVRLGARIAVLAAAPGATAAAPAPDADLGASGSGNALGPATDPDLALPETPGVTVRARGDEVEVAWSLPSTTTSPALEVAAIRHTAAGVVVDRIRLRLDAVAGRTRIAAPEVVSALAAAGTLDGDRFVPIARSPR